MIDLSESLGFSIVVLRLGVSLRLVVNVSPTVLFWVYASFIFIFSIAYTQNYADWGLWLPILDG